VPLREPPIEAATGDVSHALMTVFQRYSSQQGLARHESELARSVVIIIPLSTCHGQYLDEAAAADDVGGVECMCRLYCQA
jgi:hypothetical protein